MKLITGAILVLAGATTLGHAMGGGVSMETSLVFALPIALIGGFFLVWGIRDELRGGKQ